MAANTLESIVTIIDMDTVFSLIPMGLDTKGKELVP